MDLDPLIRLRGITKRFPLRRSWLDTVIHPTRSEYQTALDSVDLDILPGEFFGVLGQNGAGKTTLFKILATLLLPDEGSARVGSFDVRTQGARVREILTPVIAGERSLYWRISAAENLALYAALHGLSGKEARDRIRELLDRVGLTEAGDKQVGTFSTGMKQRLLIARALLSRPKVLLLDEPTRSLDPIAARDFRAFLREEIGSRQNCTVVLATHDHHEVFDLCDRVGIVEKGRLLATGPVARLLEGLEVHRYRLWVRDLEHPEVRALLQNRRVTSTVDPGVEQDGWHRIDLDIPEGSEGASRILSELVAAGVGVSRFERTEVTLAELIERIVAREAAGSQERVPDGATR